MAHDVFAEAGREAAPGAIEGGSPATRLPGAGGPAYAGRRLVRGRVVAGRDRSPVGGGSSDGVGLAWVVEARRERCFAGSGTSGAAAQAGTRATGRRGGGAGQGTQGEWLSHRVVDPDPSDRRDRAGGWGALPPRACVADLARAAGLDSAAAGPASG